MLSFRSAFDKLEFRERRREPLTGFLQLESEAVGNAIPGVFTA